MFLRYTPRKKNGKEQLELHRFWAQRLPPSRKGTRWDQGLQVPATYRLLAPGSEWRLYRHWFEHSAMADLRASDLTLADVHKLYECHERLLEHKKDLFGHLNGRWQDLFNAQFEVRLYDLTSTYFESDPPFPEKDKRKFGYSRDKRPDCVQVVIALIVTPEGFPLAYEVLAGHAADKTTLADFLKKIEAQYGKAQRIGGMDRGIPTEAVLAQMRASDPPVQYLVGTPRGRLSQYEQKLTQLPWREVREGVSVKLLAQGDELYVLAQSRDRVNKERAMRRRQLKKLWRRLKELQAMALSRDVLLQKLGAARHQYPVAARLIATTVLPGSAPLTFTLRKDKLRAVRRRAGRSLLRTYLTGGKTAQELWQFYIQLTTRTRRATVVGTAQTGTAGATAAQDRAPQSRRRQRLGSEDLADARLDLPALANFNRANPPSRVKNSVWMRPD